DARAVRGPVRPERLLPSGAVDHGEGRPPLPPLVRRRRLRRAALARPRRLHAGRRLRRDRHGSGDAGRARLPGSAELRPRRGPRRRDPRGARHPGRAAADVQHLDGRADRLRRAGRLPGRDSRRADRRRPDGVPFHLARQRQGPVPPRLAAALRPEAAGGGSLELQARPRRAPPCLVPGLSPGSAPSTKRPRPMRRSDSTLSGERGVSTVVLAPVAAAGWVVLSLTDLGVRIALFRAHRTQGAVSVLWGLGFGLFLWAGARVLGVPQLRSILFGVAAGAAIALVVYLRG